MGFLKKLKDQYEKVLLGAVLVGLLAAIVVVMGLVQKEKQELKDLEKSHQPPVKLMDPLNLSREEGVLKRLGEQITLDFTSPHNLANPVPWLRNNQDRSSGLIKQVTGAEVGPGAVEVLAIRPLHLILRFDKPDPGGYLINVKREAALNRADRLESSRLATVNVPIKNLFKLVRVIGPPENPTQLDLELEGSGKAISLKTGEEFKEIEAYSADLQYKGTAFPDRRRDSTLAIETTITVDREQYKVVAITERDVTLASTATQKRTTIHLKPAASSP